MVRAERVHGDQHQVRSFFRQRIRRPPLSLGRRVLVASIAVLVHPVAGGIEDEGVDGRVEGRAVVAERERRHAVAIEIGGAPHGVANVGRRPGRAPHQRPRSLPLLAEAHTSEGDDDEHEIGDGPERETEEARPGEDVRRSDRDRWQKESVRAHQHDVVPAPDDHGRTEHGPEGDDGRHDHAPVRRQRKAAQQPPQRLPDDEPEADEPELPSDDREGDPGGMVRVRHHVSRPPDRRADQARQDQARGRQPRSGTPEVRRPEGVQSPPQPRFGRRPEGRAQHQPLAGADDDGEGEPQADEERNRQDVEAARASGEPQLEQGREGAGDDRRGPHEASFSRAHPRQTIDL